jgi:hypothetical protein
MQLSYSHPPGPGTPARKICIASRLEASYATPSPPPASAIDASREVNAKDGDDKDEKRAAAKHMDDKKVVHVWQSRAA